MARLLQIFGFLSVLFRGATLTFQSLAVGGIVFLMFVLRRVDAESGAFEKATLRWIRRSAIALAVMQVSYVLANSLILMQSAEMSPCEVSGATFVVAGAIGILSGMAIVILTRAQGWRSDTAMLLPAAAIIASSVMTSHAMARLEYRAPLVAFTALHQAATATWLGGLPYLLIAIRRVPNESRVIW
jgi:putative copper resistance protein D